MVMLFIFGTKIRSMRISILIGLAILFAFPVSSQDFFRNGFDNEKMYVILANPTVTNIETIRYLVKNNILKIDTNRVNFVGVWFENQNYDFNRTRRFIDENHLNTYFLHEIRGKLDDESLFRNNNLTPDLKVVFENSIGIFFFGGPDIPPQVYGEPNTYSIVTDPQRHYFEATFLFHLLGGSQNEAFSAWLEEKPDYMVTGFCLGMQTMNVATGGTLIQDIPAEVYNAQTPKETLEAGKPNLHRNYWQEIAADTQLMHINLHPIHFTDHPFFTQKVKASARNMPLVYSSHHQAAEKIGKGLVVTALSADGKIVEGLAHDRFPHVFAVQFHPEVPALYEDMHLLKFNPEDKPLSYNDLIGDQSLRFHKKYWDYISQTLQKNSN